jgi:hypothetical protein
VEWQSTETRARPRSDLWSRPLTTDTFRTAGSSRRRPTYRRLRTAISIAGAAGLVVVVIDEGARSDNVILRTS